MLKSDTTRITYTIPRLFGAGDIFLKFFKNKRPQRKEPRIKKCKANHNNTLHLKENTYMMNTISAATVAIAAIFVTFQAAKSYLVLNQLAKNIKK